jgi:hypothetical protein
MLRCLDMLGAYQTQDCCFHSWPITSAQFARSLPTFVADGPSTIFLIKFTHTPHTPSPHTHHTRTITTHSQTHTPLPAHTIHIHNHTPHYHHHTHTHTHTHTPPPPLPPPPPHTHTIIIIVIFKILSTCFYWENTQGQKRLEHHCCLLAWLAFLESSLKQQEACLFFSNVHGTVATTDHMQGLKASGTEFMTGLAEYFPD